jgi:putative ABC transport system permease protein
LQCGLIAVLGVLLGVVSGVIPAAGLRLAQYRVESLWWEEARTYGGWGEMTRPELYLELPWMTFLQLIVVVPVVAGLLAALLTRSRVALARRAG